MKKYPRTHFILKKRHHYHHPHAGSLKDEQSTPTGLRTSAQLVCDMLCAGGCEAKVTEVIDNNDIDREVTAFKPDIVVIEALWVVPSKFQILQQLHPDVQWIVRVHSELPFLAQEGMAVEWLNDYLNYENVSIAFNSEKTFNDFQMLSQQQQTSGSNIFYLPNYYPTTDYEASYNLDKKDTIDIASFGAVRPMKNQLIQAFAAIQFAQDQGLGLNFHINGNRQEVGGESPYKNIRALFAELPENFQLIEHPWLAHDDFIALVRTMDVGLQMSLSETFNIVAADFVSQGVPVVTSSEIKFVSHKFQAEPTDTSDIVEKIHNALGWKKYWSWLADINKRRLKRFSTRSERIWLDFLKNTL